MCLLRLMKAMSSCLFQSRLIQSVTFGSILASATCSNALTISSVSLLPASSSAPLAAVLQLTTDDSSRVSVSASDGTETWTRDFYNYDTTHSVPLLGFKPSTTNEITVTVYDQFGNAATASEPLIFITGPLPADFPRINLLKSVPEKMEPGFTLFRVVNINDRRSYFTMVNSSGEVVWYTAAPGNGDMRRLENGDLFYPSPASFTELNMLGNTVKS